MIMHGFHMTRVDRLDSIRRHGLLPAKPTVDGHYAHTKDYDFLSEQPRGVYVQVVPGGCWAIARMAEPLPVADPVCLIADVRGYEMQRDSFVPSAYVVPHRIPPTRLVRVDDALMDDYWEGEVDITTMYQLAMEV